MTENNIELEIRSEVISNKFKKLALDLGNRSKINSYHRRLSVMFLGSIDNAKLDLRVRINSKGRAEVVIKKGDYHIHDRLEFSQSIKKNQFLGFVKIFSTLGFDSKVTERENFVFYLNGSVTAVLVKAGSISYLELETMTNNADKNRDKKKLLNIMFELELSPLNQNEFNNLCKRLNINSDWKFNVSSKNIKRLKSLLKKY